MKQKQVWRYYCDHCKKAGGSKHHLQDHEKSCTKNPDRVCNFCLFLGEKQKPISKLLASIPVEMLQGDELGSVDVPASLRDAANGCPACILAALRQSWIRKWVNFEYKKEVEQIFNEHNEEARNKDNMKNKDLIIKLGRMNPDAEVIVFADGKNYPTFETQMLDDGSIEIGCGWAEIKYEEDDDA